MQTKVETQNLASHKQKIPMDLHNNMQISPRLLLGRRKILRLYRARATAIVKYGKAIMAAVYAPNGSHDMHIPEYTVNSSGSASVRCCSCLSPLAGWATDSPCRP